jgi:hypothetical protein
LIVTSLLLLTAAIVTFLVGVFSTGLSMIGVSIGCALASGAALFLGVLRDPKKPSRVAPASATISSSEVATYAAPSLPEEIEFEPLLEPDAVGERSFDVDEAREEFYGAPATTSYESTFEPEPEPERPARKPAARKPAARKPAARKPAAAKPAARKTAAKKPAVSKSAVRKPAAKPVARKSAPAKPAAKKAAPRKSAPRKPTV